MNAEGNTLDMDCNALYLPYGDGASFAGFRPKPWPVPGTNDSLWFRGIKNLDAAIDWALLHGLADATELVVTGVSAGGLSTFLHVDRIAQRVRSRSPSVQVRLVGILPHHQSQGGVFWNSVDNHAECGTGAWRARGRIFFGPPELCQR